MYPTSSNDMKSSAHQQQSPPLPPISSPNPNPPASQFEVGRTIIRRNKEISSLINKHRINPISPQFFHKIPVTGLVQLRDLPDTHEPSELVVFPEDCEGGPGCSCGGKPLCAEEGEVDEVEVFYAETCVFEDCAFGGGGVCEGEGFAFCGGDNLLSVFHPKSKISASKNLKREEFGGWGDLVDEDEGDEALVETETDAFPARVQPH
jgi:hypothetical protein